MARHFSTSRISFHEVYYLFQISWFEQRQEGYLIHKRNTSGCSCPKYFRKGLSLQLRARHGTLLEKSVCVGLVQIISVAVDLVLGPSVRVPLPWRYSCSCHSERLLDGCLQCDVEVSKEENKILVEFLF